MKIEFVINKFLQFLLLIVPIFIFDFMVNYALFQPSDQRLQASLALAILESLFFTPVVFIILLVIAHEKMNQEKERREYRYLVDLRIYDYEQNRIVLVRRNVSLAEAKKEFDKFSGEK